MLVLAACGARLTKDQRLAGIGALGGGGGGSGVGNSGVTGPGGINPTTGATTGPGGALGPGATTGPGASAASCGTGGATDTGVTANQVRVATVSDVSGVQAALFKSTHQAMSAITAMVNSQGGICGRAIKLDPLDSQADATQNNSKVRKACDEDFAMVGSMSAFDNGGAATGQSCGIPDMTAITVNAERWKAKNVYPIYPIRPDKLAVGTANYIKEKYGNDVIQHAAMLWLNAGVTKANAQQRIKGYSSVGFKFIYRREVQVLEANYSPFVQQMKDAGVKYVNMVANLESIQRLLSAMDQADWYPTVRDWDSVAYSPKFVSQNNRPFTPANGSLVFLNTAISEEASSNPEMQLYIQWLNRVAPGAKPDYFGFYAWSAGRLFTKLATEIGGKLTRKALLDKLRGVPEWDGNGLHAPHKIGAKLMSPCFLYLEIRNGAFVRKYPPSGLDCTKGGVVNT